MGARHHKPPLLGDNRSSNVSGDLAEWLKDKGMKHSRGAPYHPQTKGKIPLIVSAKRLPGSRTLESDFEEPHLVRKLFPAPLSHMLRMCERGAVGGLEAQIGSFVDHYNHQRYYESIKNVTPADVYFGRDKAILKQRPSRDIATQYPVRQWKGSNERRLKRDACVTTST